MAIDSREKATRVFSTLLQLPDVLRLIQRGRDPMLARYTLELVDGRAVRVGTIATLWSQTEFAKVLAVSIGEVPYALEVSDWKKVIRAMIRFGTDVVEIDDEAFEHDMREWIDEYARRATTDKDGAAAAHLPFIEDGHLHVHAMALALWIKSTYKENTLHINDVRQALGDLGYKPKKINYSRRGRGNLVERTQASYHRAPTAE